MDNEKKLQKSDSVHLVGLHYAGISGNKLPLNGQILKFIFYKIRLLKYAVRESARLVLKNVVRFWEGVRIQTQEI